MQNEPEDEFTSNLRALGSAFLAASKLSPSTMWGRAAKDARFLARIDSGKSFTVRVYRETIRWFDENWPEGAVWPPEVPRPSERQARAVG